MNFFLHFQLVLITGYTHTICYDFLYCKIYIKLEKVQINCNFFVEQRYLCLCIFMLAISQINIILVCQDNERTYFIY